MSIYIYTDIEIEMKYQTNKINAAGHETLT